MVVAPRSSVAVELVRSNAPDAVDQHSRAVAELAA